MEKDNYCTAYSKLGAAGKKTANSQEEYTLFDLRRVLAIASTPVAARWAAKVDRVIAHVRAGNYANTDDAIRRMWNKRRYDGDAPRDNAAQGVGEARSLQTRKEVRE